MPFWLAKILGPFDFYPAMSAEGYPQLGCGYGPAQGHDGTPKPSEQRRKTN